MSNCIEIYNPDLRLTPDKFDLEVLREMINEVKDLKNAPDFDGSDKPAVYWFLAQNTEFCPDGSAIISFGQGLSIHTWRDFKWVCHGILGKLNKIPGKNLWHKFQIHDLDWNATNLAWYRVKFSDEEGKIDDLG